MDTTNPKAVCQRCGGDGYLHPLDGEPVWDACYHCSTSGRCECDDCTGKRTGLWANSPGVLPWRNEAGEPLMDAAALRLEYELDSQAWAEREYDESYDDYDD